MRVRTQWMWHEPALGGQRKDGAERPEGGTVNEEVVVFDRLPSGRLHPGTVMLKETSIANLPC